MAENNIIEALDELVIVVNEKPLELNPLGAMKVDGRDFLILTDMEGFIEADEYMIMEVTRSEDAVSLAEITDLEFYNRLCDMWEGHLDELEAKESDS